MSPNVTFKDCLFTDLSFSSYTEKDYFALLKTAVSSWEMDFREGIHTRHWTTHQLTCFSYCNYKFSMARRMISVSEYQNITNAVRSHCGLIVSWQKIADLKCMFLISKFYSKKVPRSFRVTALSFRAMRSRFRWTCSRLRSVTNPSLTRHRVHSFFWVKHWSSGECGHTRVCLLTRMQTQWCAM